VSGCERQPGLFGACGEHQHIPINREFEAAVERGAAPLDRPPCFDSQDVWREYVACWALKERITSRYSKHVEFCRDCSPQYKDGMDAKGRCSHRETVFIRKSSGEVVGVSSHFVSRWESALLGLHGEVVSLPDQDAVEETEAQIARARAPKKMGRPRKSEG
jgi:hypothetical protein